MNKNKWDTSHIPDQTGRVVIVTGSSSGIGFETARVLAEKGATVILAARNSEKLTAALRQIQQLNPAAAVEMMLLDLADLSSVRNFSEQFKQKYQRLDLLVNNAGVMMPPYGKTKDGFELQMGINHLGHFALAAQLFDLLTKTPGARIVNVSSMAHKYGKIDFSDLNWENRSYKKMNSYGDSKLANLYFKYLLAEKAEAAGLDIRVTAAHPGWTATELQRHSGIFNFLNRFFAQSPAMGALPTLRAATDPDALNGDYFGPGSLQEWRGYPVKVSSNRLSHNRDIARQLWDVSEALTGLRFDI